MSKTLADVIGLTPYGLLNFNSKPLDEYKEPVDVVSVNIEGSEINIYGLSDGTYVSKDVAISLAESGLLNGCIVSTSRDGHKYIKDSPDGDPSNHLRNLPRIV